MFGGQSSAPPGGAIDTRKAMNLGIPLYHGTSSLFLDDIIRCGLGGMNKLPSGRFWSARERFSHWWISTFQMKKGLSLK